MLEDTEALDIWEAENGTDVWRPGKKKY
jgi:hypothetical protein